MRKTKEIKRKRREAATQYRKGNKTDAYKLWGEAKKELQDLRHPAKPAEAAAEPATTAPAPATPAK
jgi:hypothetical protein